MLEFDAVQAVRKLSRLDPVIGRIATIVGPYDVTPDASMTTFHTLLRSIVYQQLSGAAARTILGRLCALWDEDAFPEPGQVFAASDEQLRSVGISRPKLAALRDLALRSERGLVPSIDELRAWSDDRIVDTLTEIRGVGRWTVEMLLIFRMGRPDVLPVDDLGVRKGYSATLGLGEIISPRDLAIAGEVWRPWRSVASWYLWRATELEPADLATVGSFAG